MTAAPERKPHIAWSLLPVVFGLAWPTMLEQLMQTAVQYIDTAMVGSLGTRATAAVGSATTVKWLGGHTGSAPAVGRPAAAQPVALLGRAAGRRGAGAE